MISTSLPTDTFDAAGTVVNLPSVFGTIVTETGIDTCTMFGGPPPFGGAFPLPQAAGGRYPELVLALAAGERPEPRVGEFAEGVVMTRFLSHLCLTAAPDGTLEPFSEDFTEESVSPRSLQP